MKFQLQHGSEDFLADPTRNSGVQMAVRMVLSLAWSPAFTVAECGLCPIDCTPAGKTRLSLNKSVKSHPRGQFAPA